MRFNVLTLVKKEIYNWKKTRISRNLEENRTIREDPSMFVSKTSDTRVSWQRLQITLAFRGNFPNMVKRKQSNAKLQVTTYLPDNRRKK